MFELRVFADPVELRWAGEPVRLRPKERLLLCRLAFAAGLSLSGPALAAEFLDRGSPGTAAGTLRKHVSNIRAAARQVAGAEAARCLLSAQTARCGTVYGLNLDPQCIDTTRFAQLVAAGQRQQAEGRDADAAARFGEALALWREEPLRDAAGWPFARAAAGRLAEQRRIARIGLAEIRLAAGRQREVIADLMELTAEYPADGPAWELLIRCLGRDGRDGEAADACKRAINACHESGLDAARFTELQVTVLNGSLSRLFHTLFTAAG
jgi:DNA-binding SARP family transcriptional activator